VKLTWNHHGEQERRWPQSGRHILAHYDDTTVVVYQAYRPSIGRTAAREGRFGGGGFSFERMSWVKPNFLWMMYRSGWATKEGQERVLAIDICRDGFEWALSNSCLSHFNAKMYSSRDSWSEAKQSSPVRIQWDPERDVELERLDYRAIQIGLSGEATERYVSKWVEQIADITESVIELRELKPQSRRNATRHIIENEVPYPINSSIGTKIGIQH